VQDVNPLGEFRDIEDAMGVANLDDDSSHTSTDIRHWFPVIRLLTLLDEAQLMAGNSPRVRRKCGDGLK
jgi:hypothetical protein